MNLSRFRVLSKPFGLSLRNPLVFSPSRTLSEEILRSANTEARGRATPMGKKKRVTLLPGEGIGPEICQSVVGILQAAQAPIVWERFDLEDFRDNPHFFQDVIASISRNRVALKGPLFTPIAGQTVSVNLQLRKVLDIYANIVPCTRIPGLQTRYSDTKIDLVVVRENTQGEYSGFEQEIGEGVVQSLKVITEYATRRVAELAFQYAVEHNRTKVTCIHKANIQKATDGLFLQTCRDVAKDYPEIKYDEMIIDNASMQLVMNPSQFDVVLTPNLYGNIITNVATGLVGGPGTTPGANFGRNMAMFESGARHVGQDIAGLNKANPTAMILSSCMMLQYLDMKDHADRIRDAVFATIQDKVLTQDMGGSASTKEFTKAVIDRLTA